MARYGFNTDIIAAQQKADADANHALDGARASRLQQHRVGTHDPRPLHVIARDIRNHWPNVSPHARPYLNAMASLSSIKDDFYQDSAESVVLYFLSNAATWRGEDAKRVKSELKAMLKANGYRI